MRVVLCSWLLAALDAPVSPELLGQLLDEQGGALALFAAQWTENADDCVQEALIELARQPAMPPNVVAWLYRVVRNRAISQFRSARRREHREQLALRLRWDEKRGGEAPSEPIAAEELAAVLDELPDELRECVVARLWGELSFEQMAELMGCSISTAYRRYEAGLSALRERFELSCRTKTTGSVKTRTN